MTKYFENFENDLNKMEYTKNSSEHILQLNYAYLISCMETYLSSAMWGTLDKYPESYHDLGKGINSSAKLSTIFNKGISTFIKQDLNNLQYHNLSQVKIYYKHAFNIDFPVNLSSLLKAVSNRHHIVHRCGVSKKGTKVEIDFNDLESLKEEVKYFILMRIYLSLKDLLFNSKYNICKF